METTTKKTSKTNQKNIRSATTFRAFLQGDIGAKITSNLSEEINALLQVITDNDEVLIRLESAGGVVHGYGLAASQLHRLRKKSIPLVVAVDKWQQWGI